jgi:predicted dehydrogenase
VAETSATEHIHPLVVGGGMMGALHVRGLLMREDVRSLVLVEPDRDRRAMLERQYGSIRAYDQLDAALAAEMISFAVVAVPVGFAASTTANLLRRGIPVLVEKPVATTAGDAQQLAELAHSEGTLLSVGYIERFNPAVQALRSELDSNSAGEIYHVHARRLSPFPYRQGMAGVVLDVATHDLDVLRFITQSDATRVYAEADARQGGGGPDLLSASLRYASGVTGLIEASWLSPTKVRRLTVTTDRGMYDVDYLTQDLWLYEHPRGDPQWEALGVMRGANEGRTIRFALDRKEPLAVEHASFIRAVREGGPAPIPVEDAVATLQAAEAILRAAHEHYPVELSSPDGVAS